MSILNLRRVPDRHELEARFTAFYRAHRADALRFARFRAAGCDAEALVVDAFLLAWQRLAASGELSPGWLYQVLRNKIGDYYRSASRRTAPVSPEELPDDAWFPDPADDLARRADVRRALRSLSTTHAEALLLAYWCDLSGAEAARALGLREGAFRARLLRAKRAFAEAYDGDPVTERAGVLAWIASSD